jgi:hypothetical protein
MEFIKQNIGNIIVGVIVLTTLALVIFRLVNGARQGKTDCGCGCSKCG